MRLSIVVPATNAPATLPLCLEAIEDSRESGDEVIVVESDARPGPAAARNAGAARAGGEVIVFVDADVVVAPSALSRIRDAFEADPGLAAVFGSYDTDPAEPDPVSGFRNLLHHHVHASSAGPALTFWAGLGAIRREVFEATGGFDAERYREPSIEDVELGMRISDGGGRIVLDPAIQGTHLKRWTLASMLSTDFAKRGVPWVALLAERRGAATAAAEEALGDAEMRVLNLGWRHRLSALASAFAVVALIARRPAPAVAALIALIGLNRELYSLLLDRRGAGQALAGVGLHVLHHLAAIAAVPFGLLAARRER